MHPRCGTPPDAPCARCQAELSQFCHLARKSAAVIHRHLHTSLIPQKPFDGLAWAEVFHEMDEGTRSPDRTDDGVCSIGVRQEAGGREYGCAITNTLVETDRSAGQPASRPPALPSAPAPMHDIAALLAEQRRRCRTRRNRPHPRGPTCGTISSPRSRRGSPISARIRSGSTGSARPIAAPPWPRSTPPSRRANCRRGSATSHAALRER